MPLTIEQLTRIPYLRTHVCAGVSGATNVVTWAHSNEMPTPWEWMEEGNLLMTVGLGIPKEPDRQVAYVRNLARIRASGVAIGADMLAPPLSDEMLAAAEDHGLPLLLTAYEVPFMEISRVVAASSPTAGDARMVGVERVYEQARIAAARNAGPEQMLRDLEVELECDLVAIAEGTGVVLIRGAAIDPQIATRIVEHLRRNATRHPGLRRLQLDASLDIVAVAIPARRPCSLIAIPRTSSVPAFIVLQHVATLVALEIERLFTSREERRLLGAQLFSHLLDGRISPSAALTQLRALHFSDRPLRVVATPLPDDDTGEDALPQRLEDGGLAHLLLVREDSALLLIHDVDEARQGLEDLLSTTHRIGISAPFTDLDLVRSAAQEARWALSIAKEDGAISVYGDEAPLVGPRSISEARAVVGAVLGPLIKYDDERHTDLVQTLGTFLDHNRSWQRTAEALMVHKQTLVYRMGRIEALTSRKLNDTAAVTELWVAIDALRSLGRDD